MNIPILYEDGEALVIDKPAGLPIDRPRKGGECLEDHLDSLKLGFQRAPTPVHRLDTDTSGCLLLAGPACSWSVTARSSLRRARTGCCRGSSANRSSPKVARWKAR